MASKIKTQSFLANVPLFRELGADEIDRLAAGTVERHAERGTVVANKGDPVEGFHVVVYGQVKLALSTPHGDEKVVEVIGPGFSFGEALMFLGKPYIVTATALADSLLLFVRKETVFEEIARDPTFARRMLAGLSRKLHNLMSDLEAVTLKSGRERVIGYLMRQEGAVDGDAPYAVSLPVSKAIVASRLNLTPEHFSRILHELVTAKLIEVDGRSVRILDPRRLRELP
ncbi:MAG TPA: Crp/Fnr family transcriptional regulator [Casimicrobiaceae bacterium]|jgi:CRP-like cAMP-binding protein|nr:Crp/Fnr family transcriptional regulator [Casimicrobiaceae bacterium]